MPVVPFRVTFTDIDSALVKELEFSLSSLNVEIVPAVHAGVQLIFCDSSHVGKPVRQFPGIPVVAVSSAREVRLLLDAMDSGAVDYCFSPFESDELSWILKSHCRPVVETQLSIQKAA